MLTCHRQKPRLLQALGSRKGFKKRAPWYGKVITGTAASCTTRVTKSHDHIGRVWVSYVLDMGFACFGVGEEGGWVLRFWDLGLLGLGVWV